MKQCYLAALLLPLALLPELASATNIGADPAGGSRHRRKHNFNLFFVDADPNSGFADGGLLPYPYDTSSNISTTEGNLTEEVPISKIISTLNLSFIYNSYNADGSRTTLDTVMGYGWTHSYNIFLFSQAGAIFRYDGEGRVTRYGLGPGGTFITAPGYFETLTNVAGTYTITEKDQTKYTFTQIPGTPFLVVGPVYRLTSIVDRNHNTTVLTYTAGNLTKVTDTYGRSLTFAYNAQNKLASVTDPLGRITTVQYDATGHKLLTITDPIPHSIQYTYNMFYQLAAKVDKAGNSFTYVYGSGLPGMPIGIKDSAGLTRSTLSNSNNWATDKMQLALYMERVYISSTTTSVDGRGNQWKYQYDANGYLTQKVAPDGAITKYTYDPVTLQMASMTDPLGHTTTYVYDAMGNQTQTTDALGNITRYTYDPVFNMLTSMTDARGRTTTYVIDPATGNKLSETDPLGQTRTWTYDANGNVLMDTDKNGHTTKMQYDAFGEPIKITDPLGNVSTKAYDAVGNTITQTDADSHSTSYQYDGMNRATIITDATGHTDQTSYDGEGDRIQVTDRNGHSTSYQYDQRERLMKMTDALGQNETYSYDANDNRTSTTDKNGHTTTYGYDVQNRRTTTVDALGDTSSHAFDLAGNVVADTDANGHTTAYTFDAGNRRISRTDALVAVTQYQYDTGTYLGCPSSCGATPGSVLVTGQIDPNGKATYSKYDALGREIKTVRKVGSTLDVITANDAVTTYTFDPVGNRLAMTEPNGNTTIYQYDADDRSTQVTNAAGDVTLTAYDPAGNVVSVTAPNLNATVNTYDSLNRVIKTTDSAGTVGTYTYDPMGNQLSSADGNGNTTARTYDALNRLTATIDPLGHTLSSQYDAVGNLAKTTDRAGNATTYSYDALNRRVSIKDALGNTTHRQYDAVGNLVALTDANTNITQYQYDAINQPLRETYPDGLTRKFTYDGAGNLLTRTDQTGQVTNYTYNDLYFLLGRGYPSSINDSFTYDLSGRMLTAQRGGWTIAFSYDGANRVTQSIQNGRVVGYVYNIPGRTRQLTYPGGRAVTEHTDARSRMDHIDDASSPPSIVQYTYDAGNRATSKTYRNGAAAAFSYNTNDWVTSLQHTHGASLIAGFNYTYDTEGNKQVETKLHDLAHSECYGYDATYRLTSYTVGVTPACAIPVTQTSYSLDAVGNWNSKTTDAVTQIRAHNSDNQLVKIDAQTLTYDANGNTQNDASYSYAYDEENRLIKATRNSDLAVVGQYQYDALGRRVQKTANPAATPKTTLYFYDDTRTIEEQDTAATTQATYVYGNYVDEVLTMDRGGTYYYHQNALWSVEAITDSTAAPVERYAYDAYGQATVTNGTGAPVPLNPWGSAHSAIGNPWTFTGRQLDEEAGLYFYRARYYDAQKGRFLQRDPAGYADGTNLYEYVSDRPTALSDATGMQAKPVVYLGAGPFPTWLVQTLNNNGWPPPGYQLPPPGRNMPQSLWGTLDLYTLGPGPQSPKEQGALGRVLTEGWRPNQSGTWWTPPPPPGRNLPPGVWGWLAFFAARNGGAQQGRQNVLAGVTAPGAHGPAFQVSQHVPMLILPPNSTQVTAGVTAPGNHAGPVEISQHVPILALPNGSRMITTGISTPGPHTTGPPVTPWTQSVF